MIWGHPISQVIVSIAAHFGLGSLVGLLVYFSMRIMGYGFCSQGHSDTGPSIGRRSILLVVSFSIIAHVLQDYFIRRF